MTLVSDLFILAEKIQGAQSAQDKQKFEDDLRVAVDAAVRALFDDQKPEARRLSFKTISERLGIFDAEPDKLRNILFAMDARVTRGKGDAAIWELPVGSAPKLPPKPRFFTLSKIYVLIAVLLVATSAGTFFQTQLASAFGGLVDYLTEDLPECLAAAKDPLEIDLCYEKHRQ